MRNRLIKILGGYTNSELIQFGLDSVECGKYDALLSIVSYMRSINGKSSDEWCDLVWNTVSARLDNIRKKINGKR